MLFGDPSFKLECCRDSTGDYCGGRVKHSAPLAARPLADDVADTIERGLADAIIVTGSATGKKTALDDPS